MYTYMHRQNPFNIRALAHTRSHSHNTPHTHPRSARGRDRQGVCAGSAVSAFSGTSKYPCLDKASDMLRKASGITTVSISLHPTSECHATHPASLNFNPHHLPFPYTCTHAISNSEICWEPLSYKLAYKALLCCGNENWPITHMWFCAVRVWCSLHDSTLHLHI